ncbi:hypothetical protein AKO1_013330 [Acrasis kona]|uniref:Uncharacterized protein n=1 Tax=Acrasis kona TaxID=1008807 RepID=A0AAW2YZ06_9EUKA
MTGVSLIFFITSLIVSVYASCVLETPDGTIDVSLAASTKGFFHKQPSTTFEEYFFNICKKLSNFPDIEKSSVKNAFAYDMQTYYGGLRILRPIAPTSADEVKIALADPKNTKGGVVLTHSTVDVTGADDNEKYTLVVNLTCDENENDEPSEDAIEVEKVQTESLNYKITVTTKTRAACPRKGGSHGGPLGQYGIGGLIVTLLLVCVVLYFIIGALLLKFKFQKTGSDIIPQKEFWMDLPVLVKDGCLFIFEGVMVLVNKMRGKSAVYNNV